MQIYKATATVFDFDMWHSLLTVKNSISNKQLKLFFSEQARYIKCHKKINHSPCQAKLIPSLLLGIFENHMWAGGYFSYFI